MNVKKEKSKINQYSNELVWFVCKPLIVTLFICCLLVAYFLLAGYLYDNKALRYGYWMIGVVAFIIILIIRMLFYYKSNLKKYFSNADQFGNIEYVISKNDDEYVLEDITNKNINRIKTKDIKFIKFSKNLIFIKKHTNEIIWLPKTNELVQFFCQTFKSTK